MARSNQRKATITGIGHYIPEHILTNADLEKLVETNDEWIRTRTGISERRIEKDPDKAAAHMGTQAAIEALNSANVDTSDVDAILVATVTPDYMFPATSALIQKSLGAKGAFGFDVSAACSGFLYTLSTAAMMIESGRVVTILVIGTDKMSSIVDYTDRNTCILFGDGAGAVVLQATEEDHGFRDFIHYTDGDEDLYLVQEAGGSREPASKESVEQRKHFIRQDGRAIFKRATEGMAGVAEEIMKKNKLSAEDIAWLVPHQANSRIIEATANRMGVSMDQVMMNIDKYGNTTAATIPLCLYDWKDQLQKGDELILTAFGGGLTWGATWLTWGGAK